MSTPEQQNELGKAAFARADYQTAVEHFSKVIELDKNHVLAYSNRSAAYLQLAKAISSRNNEFAELALADAEKALELDPKMIKAYTRKGAALFQLKKLKEALQAYQAGLAVDATDKSLLDGVSAIKAAIATARAKKSGGGGRATSTGAGGSSSSVPEGESKQPTADVDTDPVIGIDLGTTYSCVTYWKDGNVIVIPNDRGEMTTPSYVSFSKTGKRLVGQPAKLEAPRNPKGTIFDVKRFIGQSLQDAGVEQDVRRYPYEVVDADGSGRPCIQVMINGKRKRFAPEEISAFVLAYLKRCAEKYLGTPVRKAVITVPAYFNDSQRAATKAAGAIAGLDVLRIINEPTAAALAYGLDKKSINKDGRADNILVFDLGGGTFDVSVLTIEGGVFQVKATGGDTRLGGEDIDHTVYEFLRSEAEKQGIPEIQSARSLKRMMTAIEKAKRELSTAEATTIRIESLVARDDDEKKYDFEYELKRSEFERLTRPLFARCLDTVRKVLKDASLQPEAIDDIVLVGGSTRIPKLQEMLSEYFGGKALCRTLNPDEAVAFGAAVQAAILAGKTTPETRDLLLLDVTPLSLGIETVGRVMSVIIPRNTRIPCSRMQIYTTEENYQTEVDISVYEGERPKTTDNHFLGEFTITGIERAKRGEPKIGVTFEIDSNGMLSVTARDQKTRATANIKIARGSRASDEEVERMKEEAEQYRLEDEANARLIEARNEFEQYLYSLRSQAQSAVGITRVRRDAIVALFDQWLAWLDNADEDSLTLEAIEAKRKEVEAELKRQ